MTEDNQNHLTGGEMEQCHPEALEYHHAYLSGHFNHQAPRKETAPASAAPKAAGKKIQLKFRKFSEKEVEQIAKDTLKDGGAQRFRP
ncbi:MAG: hypothetical protein GC185_06100 [Alphaproteobacteria bacterium]|nr:hypothetical protein [Alphaproteobacteria bacterium]